MQDDQWLDLLETLKDKFQLEREQEQQITKDDVGQEIINEIDRVYFESPLGEIKLERVTRPVILDKKVHYSHTAGSKSLVEYILSPDEKTHKVTVYKKDGNDWQEIPTTGGGLKF